LSPPPQLRSSSALKIDWRAVPLVTFAIAFAAWGLSNMDQSLFGYAVPGLMGTFKIGLNAISLILSASFAFGIVVSVAVGVLTDTWGAKTTLPLCLGISAMLVGFQAFAPNALVFGCLRVAGAGFSAALAPITNALVAGRAPPRLRALLVAGLQCAYRPRRLAALIPGWLRGCPRSSSDLLRHAGLDAANA
jgi:MFS family permease